MTNTVKNRDRLLRQTSGNLHTAYYILDELYLSAINVSKFVPPTIVYSNTRVCNGIHVKY